MHPPFCTSRIGVRIDRVAIPLLATDTAVLCGWLPYTMTLSFVDAELELRQ